METFTIYPESISAPGPIPQPPSLPVDPTSRQQIRDQAKAYKACAASAAATFNAAMREGSDFVDASTHEDPIGGPIGPSTIYPEGSNPPEAGSEIPYMIFSSLQIKNTFDQHVAACQRQYPLAVLAP